MTRRSVFGTLMGAFVCVAAIPLIQSVFARIRSTPLERFHATNVAAATGPNMLLIVVDTLRADHVGMYGYHRRTTPRLDAFFAEGIVFERAYAAVASTGPSIMSMLSGLYPHHHGIRLQCQRITPNIVTFVDHLRRGGYECAAVISNAMLSDSACGLADRFDFYDDFVDEQEPFREHIYERNAARTTDAAIRWLTSNRSKDQPHFLWVHYMDPHGPYRPPADKPVDFSHETPITIDPQRVPGYSREPDVLDGNEYVDRYDEEIAYADGEIGRLLDAYAEMGLADDAVIIFTSDHGESMMDHDHWFRHEMTVHEEMVRVPLAIRYPGGQPSRTPVPVSNVDLMPTILGLASLPVPPGLDGANLLPTPQPRDVFCEGRAKGGGLWRGLIRWDSATQDLRKTMVRHGMSNVVRESKAFDLHADPRELSPIPVPLDDPALRILTELVESDPDPGGRPRLFDKGTAPAPHVAPTDDPKLLARLRALGYVGD